MSNLSAFPYIAERSEGTPGLWNYPFSIISANIAALDSGLTSSSPSGNTFSFLTNIEASGGAHFQFLSIGSTPPSYVTTAAITIAVNSSASDYLYLTDPSGQRASYIIGSRAGNTADGLNIWDASAGTMIVSFSKQSVRFYQRVVGTTIDQGGAVYNVQAYGARGDGITDDTAAIQAVINLAQTTGGGVVFLPSATSDYRITVPLKITAAGMSILGDNSGTVNGNLRLDSTNTDLLLIQANDVEVSVLGVRGPGRSTGTSRGIVIDNGLAGTIFNIRLHDLNIQSFGSDGIAAVKPELMTLAHVLSQYNGGCGLRMSNGLGLNTTISNSRFYSNDGPNQVYIENCIGTTAIGMQCLGASAASNQTMLRLNGADHFTDINGDYEFGACSVQLSGSGHYFLGTDVFSVRTAFYVETVAGNPPSFWHIRAPTSDVSVMFQVVPGATAVIGPVTNGAANPDVIASTASVTYLSPSNMRVPDGAVINPSYAFTSERSLGLYRSQGSTLALSYGTFTAAIVSATTAVASVFSTTIASGNVELKIGQGSAARTGSVGGNYYMDVGHLNVRDGDGSINAGYVLAYQGAGPQGPGFAFTSEASLGLYRSGKSAIGLSYGALELPDGSSTTPSLGYNSNSSLGFYSPGVQTIAQSYGTFDLTATIASLGTIRVKSGANNSCGTAVLGSNGSVNVANTYVKTGDLIFLTDQTAGGTLGDLEIGGIRNSSGFTILSTSLTDTSTVAWLIIRPG